VLHRFDQCPVPLTRPASAPASYHVALDTMMGRRCRHRPDEVSIDGFLLLDTGDYARATALLPLDVFWKMKALDILGHVRSENRARTASPDDRPEVGSVWAVDGWLEAAAAASDPNGGAARDDAVEAGAGSADEVLASTVDRPDAPSVALDERTFRLHVHAVYALDRVAIEAQGPRFIETLHVRDMLPAIDG
jgi:hypothetical protein